MTGAELRVVAHLTTIPMNLLLVAWVGVGRLALVPPGAAGSAAPTTLTAVTPALVLLLGLTSALAVRQHRRGGGLTAPQSAALLGCWGSLAGFGGFLTEAAAGAPVSPFTQLAGERFASLSDALALACLYGFVAAWITLLVLLRRRPSGAAAGGRTGARRPVGVG
ncbi:hypothetical protein [Nakamurella sp.]|uniref:hypothetical protein n=1 Tax=Nakamurella sp. TaxID=1869182 RepID=UPI003B3AC969